MSQIADLVLNNGTTNATYSVVSTQTGETSPARFRGPGSALSANRVSALTRRVKGARKSKAILDLAYPMIRTVDGIEELIATANIGVEFSLPDVFLATDREKMAKELASLIANVLVLNLIKNDSPLY